jgi:hypothetical protein
MSVGDSHEEFTVELHHGGFFVGHGQSRSYVDGKINWFDNCEADTWSTLCLNDFNEQLGYSKTPLLKYYWLLPGKNLSNGLRIIIDDSDTIAMRSVVDRIKTLVVYLDPLDSFAIVNWDDIIDNPVSQLPKVMSPVKVVHVDKKQEEKLPDFYADVEQIGTDSEDSDFLDSDYEVEDGDDNLFVDHVDEGVEDDVIATRQRSAKTKKAPGSKLKRDAVLQTADVSSSDEDELVLPEDDRDGLVNAKFNSFKEADISNPAFKVGMVFDTIVTLRKAIKEYSLKNRVSIRMPRNEKTRITAHCVEGCPWYLYASFDKRVKAILVKTYVGKHNCQKEFNIKSCTASWLAEKYVDCFRADNKMSISSLAKMVQKEWNLTPSRSKLARARRIAMKKVYGDEDEQYNLLWDYGNEIRRSNPNSSFFLNLEVSHFSTCYMSLDACKRGFMAACRPLICLDGCHLKTKYGGQLLTAVGIDPNDCIYPIAFAVVEVESKASWIWFLETLKKDLGIINTYPWTLMTDKQKVSNLCCL